MKFRLEDVSEIASYELGEGFGSFIKLDEFTKFDDVGAWGEFIVFSFDGKSYLSHRYCSGNEWECEREDWKTDISEVHQVEETVTVWRTKGKQE